MFFTPVMFWLRGKGLHPVVEGNQSLLLLTT
jgi:hypothetical protein